MSDTSVPRIGVGMWVRKDGKLLLGRRTKKGFGENTWCVPGGAVEFGETVAAAAVRETKEETGLVVSGTEFIGYVEDIFEQHWLTLYFVADWQGGEPIDEVGTMEGWQWFEWDKLPQPLYGPTNNFIRRGIDPTCIKI